MRTICWCIRKCPGVFVERKRHAHLSRRQATREERSFSPVRLWSAGTGFAHTLNNKAQRIEARGRARRAKKQNETKQAVSAACHIHQTNRKTVCACCSASAPVYSQVLSCALVRALGHKSVLALVREVQIEKPLGRWRQEESWSKLSFPPSLPRTLPPYSKTPKLTRHSHPADAKQIWRSYTYRPALENSGQEAFLQWTHQEIQCR